MPHPMQALAARTAPTEPVLISFYCNKGGVGKTTLVHNLSYLLAQDLKLRVLAVDADPQCNLSNQLLKTPSPSDLNPNDFPEDLEELVSDFYESTASEIDPTTGRPYSPSRRQQRHIYDCFKPLIDIRQREGGDFMQRAERVQLKKTAYENLFLLPGHIRFSDADVTVASAYQNQRPNNVSETETFIYLTQYIRRIATIHSIDVVLIDLNPGISILNANYLLASNYFFIPAYPDCFTRQGIDALNQKFVEWVSNMAFYRAQNLGTDFHIGSPAKFLGYTALRYPRRHQRTGSFDVVKAYLHWWNRIHEVLNDKLIPTLKGITTDAGPSPMVAEHFHFFRQGIKNFSSPGQSTQEQGWPISDTNHADDHISRLHFNRKFKGLISNMLGNMEYGDLTRLGFVDPVNFRVSNAVFGPIKTNNSYTQVSFTFEGRRYNFRQYAVGVDSTRDNFYGLPIPLDSQEMYKQLETHKDDSAIRRGLANEAFDFYLKLQETDPTLAGRFYRRFFETEAIKKAMKSYQDARDNNDRKKAARDEFVRVFSSPTTPRGTDFIKLFLERYLRAVVNPDNREFEGSKFTFLINGKLCLTEAALAFIAILMRVLENSGYRLIIWTKNQQNQWNQHFNFVTPELDQCLMLNVYFNETHEIPYFHFMLPVTPANELVQAELPVNNARLFSGQTRSQAEPRQQKRAADGEQSSAKRGRR